MKTIYVDSPVGVLKLQEDTGAIVGLHFVDAKVELGGDETPLLMETVRQLKAYFAGERTCFDVPIRFSGTVFQEKVWQGLCTIPYGQVRTYGDMACLTGSEKAFRAVGMACHVNPISIIVPCHRVVGKNGAMTGFGGGLWRKEKLLALEWKYSNQE